MGPSVGAFQPDQPIAFVNSPPSAVIVPSERAACYDFIIASDVFEHIAPPVSRAFVNARRLLKPGGVMIFSVPFSLEADTVERFPELFDYRLLETGSGWQL